MRWLNDELLHGNYAYGRLGISCGCCASVVRNIPVNAGDGLEDFSLMTTAFLHLILAPQHVLHFLEHVRQCRI